jgi:hypothetical protein
MPGGYHFYKYVKNGSLYIYGGNKLLVFDVRSDGGIRKLGHFVRGRYAIEDVEVLDNGNMLLSVWRFPEIGKPRAPVEESFVYLLKDPRD